MAAFSITAEELMAQTIAAINCQELGQPLSDEEGAAFVTAMTGLPMGDPSFELPKSQADTDELLGQFKDMPLEVFEMFKTMASKGAGKGKQGDSMGAGAITADELVAQMVIALKARATELGHPLSDEDAEVVGVAMGQASCNHQPSQAEIDESLGQIKEMPKEAFEQTIEMMKKMAV